MCHATEMGMGRPEVGMCLAYSRKRNDASKARVVKTSNLEPVDAQKAFTLTVEEIGKSGHF